MRRVLTLGLFSILACGPVGPVSDLGENTGSLEIREGSPEAVGILDLLNARSTTFEVLDDQVGLDRRAAANLITHRDGRDGRFPSSDDDQFDSIAEVDAVAWVGESAITSLLSFARDAGWVPASGDVIGVYDGVSFTVAEADAVLVLVNSASETFLDEELGLDHRAATSILDARPIATVEILSGLYYVGRTALELLKTAAASVPEPGDDCTRSSCAAGLQCVGIPRDGSSDFGKCIDPRNVPGQGASCTSNRGCGTDLVCVGFKAYGSGECAPAWMAHTFSNGHDVTIPTSSRQVAQSSVVVRGLASVPVDIVVRLDLDHQDPEDLRIELVDPNGDVAMVSDRDVLARSSSILVRGISGDDEVNGQWTLRIRDYSRLSTPGVLRGWKLELTSRWD